MTLVKPTLTIIQSTHASLAGFQQMGLLERHRRLLAEYSKVFRVVQYSCDEADYSAQLGVEHRPVPWLPRAFGWRHLVFYLWLVWQAPRMKGVIKVFGSNIPTLPLVKLLSGRPMMVTYQFDYARQTQKNEPKGLKHWLPPFLERLALSPADLVLVTADWLEEKAQRVYHKKTVLLPNWVDVGVLEQVGTDKTRDEKTVLYAGRLHWSKGINILIDAFVKVKQRHPDAMLTICGEGEERERLEAQVKSLSLNDVQFRGGVPNAEVLRLMSKAAVFVLPTLTMEGHPKALIEAMACGAACVASSVAGNRSVIVHGENGLLVPPNDSARLADVLSRLLDDKTLRTRLGWKARENALQYNFNAVVSSEMHILLSLANW